MLLCQFRIVVLSTAAVSSTKSIYFLAGYLKGVNSVCALQQGHLLFWGTFPPVLYTIPIYHVYKMLIKITYFDNLTYNIVIICIEHSLIMDYNVVQGLSIKSNIFNVGQDILQHLYDNLNRELLNRG